MWEIERVHRSPHEAFAAFPEYLVRSGSSRSARHSPSGRVHRCAALKWRIAIRKTWNSWRSFFIKFICNLTDYRRNHSWVIRFLVNYSSWFTLTLISSVFQPTSLSVQLKIAKNTISHFTFMKLRFNVCEKFSSLRTQAKKIVESRKTHFSSAQSTFQRGKWGKTFI